MCNKTGNTDFTMEELVNLGQNNDKILDQSDDTQIFVLGGVLALQIMWLHYSGKIYIFIA